MKQLFILALALAATLTANATNTSVEDRQLWGSIAVPPGKDAINWGDYKSANNNVLLTWRMLPDDDGTEEFDLWRKMGENGQWTRVNKSAAIQATCYQHAPLSTITGDVYYRLTYRDQSQTSSDNYIGEYVMKKEQATAKVPYISIPLKTTEDVSGEEYANIFKYQANDCSVGDLDGDGKMEVVVKRLLTYYDADGNVIGTSEGAGDSDKRAKHIAIFDAYKLDGTFMWRVMSGPNIIAGNSINFAVADLDGDGCCEVVTKTGEGTIFGDGKEIGDTDGDGMTDYRDVWPAGHYTGDGPKGYGGPEFFSVIDGKTGRELARNHFIARGPEGQTPAQWVANWEANDWQWDPREKKYYWKLANSLRLGVAEFTGRGIQVFLGRGVYGRTVVEAWDYQPGTADAGRGLEASLTRVWKFDTDEAGGQDKNKDGQANRAYAGQGNHAFNVADLDGDGLDEVMYGSCAFDNDGTGLWTTGLGHGDANHVGVFQKGYEGLQVYHCLENGKTEVALHDAKTGAVIWDIVAAEAGDQGRCMVADVDPDSPGCEFWKYGNELFDQNGQPLMTSDGSAPAKESSCNAGIWFDGSLSRQTINGSIINSYAHGRTFTMYRYDISFNNSTKSNPGWYGDMLGDWREEVIVPDATKLKDIKLFSTWYPTTLRIPYLMSDHTYRMQAIHEQVGYNQPTNVGYYIGSDQNEGKIWAAAKKAEADRLAARATTLSINELPSAVSRQSSSAWYNLLGQQVQTPVKGHVYIHHGRKVIIR